MTGARFNTKLDRWIVSTENGVVARPRIMILCAGFASKPYTPPFKGLETFKGVVHHTYHWPKDGVDMTGLHIGVIGTGATGVQVVQEAAPVCAHLTVFQRTPNTAFAMMQQKLDVDTQTKLTQICSKIGLPLFRGSNMICIMTSSSNYPLEEERTAMLEGLWQRGGLSRSYWLAGFLDMFTCEEANTEIYSFWRAKVIPRLKGPKLRAKLAPEIPPHPFGVKRPSLLEQNFYDVFNQPNVMLVDLNETPISEITEAGVRTSKGKEHTFAYRFQQWSYLRSKSYTWTFLW